MSDPLPWCLVSDIDDTLTGDTEALVALLECSGQDRLERCRRD